MRQSDLYYIWTPLMWETLHSIYSRQGNILSCPWITKVACHQVRYSGSELFVHVRRSLGLKWTLDQVTKLFFLSFFLVKWGLVFESRDTRSDQKHIQGKVVVPLVSSLRENRLLSIPRLVHVFSVAALSFIFLLFSTRTSHNWSSTICTYICAGVGCCFPCRRHVLYRHSPITGASILIPTWQSFTLPRITSIF